MCILLVSIYNYTNNARIHESQGLYLLHYMPAFSWQIISRFALTFRGPI